MLKAQGKDHTGPRTKTMRTMEEMAVGLSAGEKNEKGSVWFPECRVAFGAWWLGDFLEL